MVLNPDRFRNNPASFGEPLKQMAQDGPFEEPVTLPIEDVLDLHTFAPNEIASVIEEYLWQCRRTGLLEVRLIHGKGTGTQRAIVRRLLTNHPDVLSFADAPTQAGGWGGDCRPPQTARRLTKVLAEAREKDPGSPI